MFIILPNLFFVGAFFYALAITSRRMVLSYIGGILLFMAYVFALASIATEHSLWATIAEPFGTQAVRNKTQYWTPQEQNEQYVSWSGTLLWNRLFWLALGTLILGGTFWKFSMAHQEG